MGRALFAAAMLLIAALAAGAYASGNAPGLAAHWSRPVKAASARMHALSLRPQRCGACHAERFGEWKGALHGRSTGPGLAFQLAPSRPEEAAGCLYCHAPLVSQSESQEDGAGGYGPNPGFDEALMRSGVSCAVCHVRDGVVRGPNEPVAPDDAPHASVQKEFFRSSQFCAACHQLDDGYSPGGKPLMNTYAEWAASVYARRGVTCQGCHMPGGRHLFRGIHDPATVRDGVRVEAERRTRGTFAVRITNTGAGHYFPTYATPLVVIKGFQADARGQLIKGSTKEAYVGRKVPLDLSKEFFDTRIAPLKSFELTYGLPVNSRARSIVFEVRVYPDEFYARFYKRALEKHRAREGRREIASALDAAGGSGYLLFRKEMGLGAD